MWRGAQLGGDRRAAQRRGVPAAEADEPVYGGDGPASDVTAGVGAPRAAQQLRGAGPGRVPADGAGASTGDVTGYGEAVVAGWLADDAPGRRGSPSDLGRCLRTSAAACTPPAAVDLGKQGSAGRIESAEAPPGAVECRRPASRRAGSPHRALGGHDGWIIETTFQEMRPYLGLETTRGRVEPTVQ